MKRRTFVTALALGPTGCLNTTTHGEARNTSDGGGTDESGTPPNGGDPDTRTQTGTTSGSVEPAEQRVLEASPPVEEAVETVRVGDGPGDDVQPHGLVVWNDGPKRAITTTVRAPGEGLEPSRTTTLGEGQYLVFELTEQVDYEITVSVDGGTRYGIELSESMVDCNASRTTVRIPGSGPVEYETVSTMLDCSPVTVTTSSGDRG